MGLVSRFFGRKTVDPDERRSYLLERGRITEGLILDSSMNGDGDEIVYYLYTLNGVDFESSEVLTSAQREQPAKYAPGAKVGIRYDPRNQGNSIVE